MFRILAVRSGTRNKMSSRIFLVSLTSIVHNKALIHGAKVMENKFLIRYVNGISEFNRMYNGIFFLRIYAILLRTNIETLKNKRGMIL